MRSSGSKTGGDRHTPWFEKREARQFSCEFVEFVAKAPLSCGTPSMNVLTPGFVGLPPMPRKNGLLTALAVNSLTNVLGA